VKGNQDPKRGSRRRKRQIRDGGRDGNRRRKKGAIGTCIAAVDVASCGPTDTGSSSDVQSDGLERGEENMGDGIWDGTGKDEGGRGNSRLIASSGG
jgi:hypothetical protein